MSLPEGRMGGHGVMVSDVKLSSRQHRRVRKTSTYFGYFSHSPLFIEIPWLILIMHKVFGLIPLICLLFSCTTNKIFIVRHAEKAAAPRDNPNLNQSGNDRARDLAFLLNHRNIRRIYATETNRAIETATPLSQMIDVPVERYSNDTLLKFLVKVVQSEQTSLIIGHSNTVLRMLEELEIAHRIRTIADNDYDNLFIIKVRKGNPIGYKYRLKERTYGRQSPSRGDTTVPTMMTGN